jgi:glutamyl-tRNA synthetase
MIVNQGLEMSVRTRFAPSPTGLLHVGGVRTALYSWLFARRHGGAFVLRIEDTDRERSSDQAVEVILGGMKWLGLDADEGPYYQSKRGERYDAVVELLLQKGLAYQCFCTKADLDQMRADQMARKEKPRYDGRCRTNPVARLDIAPVIRFKNPQEGSVVVDDRIHGAVVFQNTELDDLIIRRSDGSPTYNFSVVVDDWDMKITHVIRGDDHLNNTPRQINMLRALGAAPPVYAHLPMILGADGTKLSKRHGAVSVLEYERAGFLPEALLNYLVRLGWSHGDQELFTIGEMIAEFDIADVNKAASVFDPEKLRWVNQQHIMRADSKRLAEILADQLRALGIAAEADPKAEAIVQAQRERAKTMTEMAENSVFFYRAPTSYTGKDLQKHLTTDAIAILSSARTMLETLPDWTTGSIGAGLQALAQRHGVSLGKVAQPLRVAVSGSSVSPPIDQTLALLSRDEALTRIARAESTAAESARAQ